MPQEIFDIVVLTKGCRIRKNGGVWTSNQSFNDLKIGDNYVILMQGAEQYPINFPDDIVNIDEGSGLVEFSGTPLELGDKLHELFFKAGSSASTTEVATYADLLSAAIPSTLKTYKVLSDENKGTENTIYQLWPDGTRLYIASQVD